MTQKWNELIHKNFDNAAEIYNDNAELQKTIALKLATICSKQSIPSGIWADLGSGTGFLAESLECFHPNQPVIRIDKSKNMIAQQAPNSCKKIWDLNLGLPKWPEPPTLLASNFVLHWLIDPKAKLKEWFKSLASGGWIALSIPIQGSFPEWQNAATAAGVPYTGLELPSQKNLIDIFPSSHIRYQELIKVTQTKSCLNVLFKTITKVGAQTSPKPPLSIGEWRRLKKSWQILEGQKANLTWIIQILLIEK
tara:strand:- start:118 stop:870 length:753 start_codon:yes stop_codon:yes gene_type:complete